jgi:hypothetical protein
MKNTFLIFLLVTCPLLSNGQKYIDLIKLDYAITPEVKFDSSATVTKLQEINGDLTIPIPINDKFTLLTGLAYENSLASFDPGRKIESLTGLTLKMGTNIKHNTKWSGTYMILPKISSDFNKLSNRDFQIGGVVLMKYEKSDHFNYRFGIYSNSELFGPFIVPIFGFYYLNPTNKFEAKVLLPLSVDLNYKFYNSFRFGLNFKGQVRSYNINIPMANETDRYLVKSANDVYSYLQYCTKKGLNFQLGFGRSFARSYRMQNEKVKLGIPLLYINDNRTQLNSDFADSWLIKFTVFYRLKLD